ncbi:hypothetical protein M2390_003240 [Mycetocola sp. BIGb0189]|uniref:hypothetical protein n=1 Tax=Mycetocola sp. BIGb0189 TaxID=2940604 RepID=UPI002169C545|nr:hypothetical protein [Mycetocola sp. BIGb0189]MCS4278020.1 hypothetical protein [Mycetocola sp. BIGb0189]
MAEAIGTANIELEVRARVTGGEFQTVAEGEFETALAFTGGNVTTPGLVSDLGEAIKAVGSELEAKEATS